MCFLKSVLKLSWHLYSSYSLICHCYQSISCFPFFMTQQTPVLKWYRKPFLILVNSCLGSVKISLVFCCWHFWLLLIFPSIRICPSFWVQNISALTSLLLFVWFISFLEAQNYFKEVSPASLFIAATLKSVCMRRWEQASKMIAVAV